jgi:hypothetical protein
LVAFAGAAFAGAARFGFAAAGDALVGLAGVDFFTVSLATSVSPPRFGGYHLTLMSYGCNVPLFQFGDIQRPACY